MLQDRSLLEQNLIKPTLEVKRKRKIVKDIKTYLSENHAIFEGSIQSWINNPAEELKEIDTRLLYLFANQIYQKTGDQNINPEEFFTELEIKTARQYSGKMYIEESVEFPIRFHPAIQIDRDVWNTKIDIKSLVSLLKSKKLNWNPESQRESTYRVVNGDVIEEATLYMDNVNQIKGLLKQNKLEKTQITLNVSLGSAGDKEDVVYNPDNYELTVNDAKIDVIDGWHRIKGSELALSEKNDIDFTFELKILNMSVDRAARYLAQTSIRTPISETKRKTMGKETYADVVIDELKKSKIGDRISKKEMLSSTRKELVTYNSLSYAINKYFDIQRKLDAYSVSDYLSEGFDVLLETYEDEFTNNYSETRKSSLINNNLFFVGYITLLSKMKNKGIEARHITKYIKSINFDKNNKTWLNNGILDEKGRFTKNARNAIEELFNKIEVQ